MPLVRSEWARVRTLASARALWLLLFLAVPAADAYAERLPIKTYTTADGLAHNNVKRIVKDSRGFLWFCTADGLSRFDGYTFTNFGVDRDCLTRPSMIFWRRAGGEYWVATNGGLVRFDPKGRPGSRVIYENDARDARPDVHGRRCRTMKTGAPGPSPCCVKAATARSGSEPDKGLYRLRARERPPRRCGRSRSGFRTISGATRHRGRAGRCARLAVDRGAERSVSPLA